MCALAAAVAVQAHETDPSAIPDSGLRLGAAVAATLSDARHPLPSSRLPGVLGTGQHPRDNRGLRLEHAVAEVAGRHGSGLGGQLVIGLHDRDKAHVEAAWLDMALAGGDVHLGAGRNTVPTTPALSRGGHFDKFALTPLAKRAVFEGDWIEDGVSLAWRPHDGATGLWPDRAGIGVWRGKSMPAGGRPPGSTGDRPITLNAGWDVGPIQADVFAARMRPVARGSLVQSDNTGHTHGAPTCDESLQGRVCFDGKVSLWGGTLGWTPHPSWTVSTTAVWREEKGALYSPEGDTRYRGRTTGFWTDLTWRFQPGWEAAMRAERLTAKHDVEGVGASLTAQGGGLLDNHAKQRLSASLGWSGAEHWRIGAEAGEDRTLGMRNPYVLVRAIWSFNVDWRLR